jgi:hypothetical protein
MSDEVTQSGLEDRSRYGGIPARAGREGDSQPMPISVSQSAAVDPSFVSVLGAFVNLRAVPDEVATQVGRDVAKRTQLGIERYGTPLMTWNGRDAATDAYEEAMDLAKYCTQLYMEHPTSRSYRLLMLSAMELLLTLAEIRYGR